MSDKVALPLLDLEIGKRVLTVKIGEDVLGLGVEYGLPDGVADQIVNGVAAAVRAAVETLDDSRLAALNEPVVLEVHVNVKTRMADVLTPLGDEPLRTIQRVRDSLRTVTVIKDVDTIVVDLGDLSGGERR